MIMMRKEGGVVLIYCCLWHNCASKNCQKPSSVSRNFRPKKKLWTRCYTVALNIDAIIMFSFDVNAEESTVFYMKDEKHYFHDFVCSVDVHKPAKERECERELNRKPVYIIWSNRFHAIAAARPCCHLIIWTVLQWSANIWWNIEAI